MKILVRRIGLTMLIGGLLLAVGTFIGSYFAEQRYWDAQGDWFVADMKGESSVGAAYDSNQAGSARRLWAVAFYSSLGVPLLSVPTLLTARKLPAIPTVRVEAASTSPASPGAVRAWLNNLEALRAAGAISEAEFTEQRRQIIAQV
ncbi:hypothetical protein GCM10009844_31060 [Nocardioides koreensis]|uniref:SHOCT domain-containing protein n=1 Tax=Nocardioides koreensis TaxID=433651 RepID=A0ABN2ZYP4_9ACTN